MFAFIGKVVVGVTLAFVIATQGETLMRWLDKRMK